jgi:hypothetical protein
MVDALADDITLICGLALVVGLVGTVLPVLPGGALIVGAIGVWALVVQTALGWVAFVAALVLVVAGAVLKYLTAGRVIAASQVPRSSLVAGGLLGIVGFFVVPVIGLVLGLVLGLYAAETYRHGDARAAWASSVVALKGVGLGILVELAAALLAVVAWLVAVWAGAAG